MITAGSDGGRPVRLQPAHRAKPGLESAVVRLDTVVGIPGVMVRARGQLADRLGQHWRPVGGHLDGFAVSSDRRGEELRGCRSVTLLETYTSMTCPFWSRSRYDRPNRRYQRNRQQDHLRREPEAGEGHRPLVDRRAGTAVLHFGSLTLQARPPRMQRSLHANVEIGAACPGLVAQRPRRRPPPGDPLASPGDPLPRSTHRRNAGRCRSWDASCKFR